MPHTGYRMHRLFADRVRMSATARRGLYATLAGLIGSGAWWLAVRYGVAPFSAGDVMTRLAAESLALKVHGATAFASLYALGAISAQHVRLGWALRRNRRLGIVVLAVFGGLVVTGYARYYLVSDESRASVSLAHWIIGAALAPLIVWHIASGRKSRVQSRHATDRAAPEATR